MSERRSSRARKPIKYSAPEDLSDDDFADATPPPPKKQREEKSTSKKDAAKDKETPVCKTVADVYEPESSRKRRIPLSDKIYERELQQALEISLIQSQGSPDLDSKKRKINTPTVQEDETKGCEKSKPSPAAAKHVSGVVVEESIELMGEEVENAGRGVRDRSGRCSEKQDKRKAASVKGKLNLESDDDDDYASDVNDDSDDSAEEDISDEDSDFGYTPKSAKKKKTPAKKTKSTLKPIKKDTASKIKPSAVPSTTKTNVSRAPAKVPEPPSLPKVSTNSTKKTSSAPSRSPAAPSSLTSSWKPPAFSGSGSSSLPIVKSPTSGLRLGLSRNQRVKPLHPSVRVT